MSRKRRDAVLDGILMSLHDLSVSGDPSSESCARFLKATMHQSMLWLEDEHQRKSPATQVIEAMIKAHIGIAHLLSVNVSMIDSETMLRMLGEAYQSNFERYAEFNSKLASAKPQKAKTRQ